MAGVGVMTHRIPERDQHDVIAVGLRLLAVVHEIGNNLLTGLIGGIKKIMDVVDGVLEIERNRRRFDLQHGFCPSGVHVFDEGRAHFWNSSKDPFGTYLRG